MHNKGRLSGIIAAAGFVLLAGCLEDPGVRAANAAVADSTHSAEVVTDNYLGDMYYHENRMKYAFYWYRKAADLGSAHAETELGLMYSLGQYTGLPQPQALEHADPKSAFAWWQKGAEQGDALAQFNLGRLYEEGRGVPKNYRQAIGWLRRSADGGHEGLAQMAQFSIGQLYEKGGPGIAQNYTRAAGWYRKAVTLQGACTGLSFMQLGYLYERGEGVPQSHLLAYTYWDIALRYNMPFLRPALTATAQRLSAAQLARAKLEADAWKAGDPAPTLAQERP